jgi:hypothetical protein
MRSKVAFALENAVIPRQRSPWQTQGLPTKDLCTPPTPPKTRGAPSFAIFAKGGSVELHDIRTLSCFLPLRCHPERSKIVRSRTILRSRGTCFSADTRHQSPCDKSVARTNSRSFDSGNELASDSVPCAKDDNFEKRKATNGRPHLRMSCRMAAFAPETLSS